MQFRGSSDHSISPRGGLVVLENTVSQQNIKLLFKICFELTNSSGNIIFINGFHLPHNLTSRTIDMNSLKHFGMSNLVGLDLSESNVNRVSTIFHGDLPNLKTLSFKKCKGIVDSDVNSLKGVPNLGNHFINFYPKLLEFQVKVVQHGILTSIHIIY